ncbi:hypothetical protein GCM10011350_36310 [Marinomonas arctica]|nr:hypothetical protein GCM10011350_36310 [Marinomonas arctica]
MTINYTLVNSNLDRNFYSQIKSINFNNLIKPQNLGTLSAPLELLIQKMSKSFEFMEN